ARGGLTQDAGVAVARREELAFLEAMWAELGEARIGMSENKGRDMAPERWRQLEAVPACAGVDEHPFRDFADHGLPIGADVVQARPAPSRLGVVHQWVAPRDRVLKLELFVALDRLVEAVWTHLLSRMRPAHHVLVGTLRATVVAGNQIPVAEGDPAGVLQARGGDHVALHGEREIDPDPLRERPRPRSSRDEQAFGLKALLTVQQQDGSAPGPQLNLLHD